jgi:hypothetical protein
MRKDEAQAIVSSALAREAQRGIDEVEAQAKLAEASGTAEGAVEADFLRTVARAMADLFMDTLAASAQKDRGA